MKYSGWRKIGMDKASEAEKKAYVDEEMRKMEVPEDEKLDVSNFTLVDYVNNLFLQWTEIVEKPVLRFLAKLRLNSLWG